MYDNELKDLSYEEWEFFAQDVLCYLGFKIIRGPSEGADAGLDLKVRRNEIDYLVSCKHLNKNIGTSIEQDILDRIEQHDCKGFIAFYSTGITTSLKLRFEKFREKNISIIELCKDEIFDIIPHLSGWVLQKYFKRPHELYNHKNIYTSYKALICMLEGCGKDLLLEENLYRSLGSLMYDEEKKEINFVYGCKSCLREHLAGHWEWVELSQTRYIEELLCWRDTLDSKLKKGYKPSKDFYENWANYQEAMIQSLIPPGWGKWI